MKKNRIKTYETHLNGLKTRVTIPENDDNENATTQIATPGDGETKKETARRRYIAAKDDIAAILDLIGQEMDIHAANAAKHPTNWGPHGDAIGIRTSLKNVLQFLIGGRNRWAETEASEFIEAHLAAMREGTK